MCVITDWQLNYMMIGWSNGFVRFGRGSRKDILHEQASPDSESEDDELNSVIEKDDATALLINYNRESRSKAEKSEGASETDYQKEILEQV